MQHPADSECNGVLQIWGDATCMPLRHHLHPNGFTLIETMVSVALLATLMGLTLPSLAQHWQRTRRQDAQNTLRQLHLRQIQWRGLHPQFASSLQELGWLQPTSSAGFYSISLQTTHAQSYQLHATAVGIQTRDADCQVISLAFLQDGTLVKTSNQNATTDPGRCWTW